jgi:SAM-dependent methyltransferase
MNTMPRIPNRVSSTSAPPIVSGSPDRFGYEWSRYSFLRPEYEVQFRNWTTPLKPSDWKGRFFLDVGCGMGRNSVWPMKYGAAGGVAVDVDKGSLSAATKNLKDYESVAVEECSAYDLPYKGEFDIVYSIGVIHHLEFPQRALSEMVKAAKPGGKVLIWVYGLENNEWIVRFFNPFRSAIFSRMPISLVHHLSLYPAVFLWLVLKLGFGRIKYFQFLSKAEFGNLRSIVFDQMLPKIANYWPADTVKGLMTGAGLKDVQLSWVNEMSWTAIGMKPSSFQE